MNAAFYIAGSGAKQQQAKMDIIGNNLANINTLGYKKKNGVFSDLMHYSMRPGADGGAAQTGSGIRMSKVDTDYSAAALSTTAGKYDFAIQGEGFFMLSDPVTNEITYTRDGDFQLSLEGDTCYLVSASGKRVMNSQQQQIIVPLEEARPGADGNEENAGGEVANYGLDIGVYRMRIKTGMQNVGDNEFSAEPVNGEPILMANETPLQGALEMSNVDLALEMSKLVEVQRAYSGALKMIQISDEVDTLLNSLR